MWSEKSRLKQEKPVMAKLQTLFFRARALALTCALFVALPLVRFARLRGASRPRTRLVRARFAYSGFRRLACLAMSLVMIVQFALFPPEVARAAVKSVSATVANAAHDGRFWWHSSGWAARSERFLRETFPNFGANAQQRNWDGKGAPRRAMPKSEPQETQDARNERVARVDISPREATIAAGQVIHFVAVAYDADNSPIGGVSFDWDKEDEDTGERVIAEERGKFSSANGRFSSLKEGNYRVKARFGGFEASAKVKVKGLKYLSGQQPIGTRTEPPRESRRQINLSQAAAADSYSWR
jgi:hypothetical protein